MRKKSELFFSLILLPIDFVMILGAFVLAYIIRVKLDNRPVHYPISSDLFLKIFLLVIPVWILIFALSGLYNLSSLRGRLDELGKTFVAVSGGVMFLIMVDFVSRQPIFPSKSVPIYGYGLSLLFVILGRQVVRGIQRYLFSYGIGVHRAAIIGSGEIAQRISQDLGNTRQTGYELVGVIDTASGAAKRMEGFKVYNSFEALLKKVNAKGIDELIQADSALPPESVLDLVNYASNNHLAYRFVPNQFGMYATNSDISTVAGMPMVEIKHTPLEGWGRILKRTFDLLGAGFGLIVASPIFLVVGILIKLTDPGPVFYRHKRLSRIGKVIYIYKFRSMKAKYSTGAGYSGKSDAEVFSELGRPELAEEFKKEQKVRDDPRVSRIGKFLRKTSLDELPQLVNVLLGDLSLVGPRPIVLAELERYGSGRSTFLALKPGLTGLWQISGRSDISYEERVKLDIFYVENWSLWLDIKILMKTVLMVLKGRGAY